MDGNAEKEEEKKETFIEFLLTLEGLILLIILGAILLRLDHYFTGGSFGAWLSVRPNVTQDWNAVRVWFSEALSSVTALINGFCLLLAVVIGYVIFRQIEVNKLWHEQFYPPEQTLNIQTQKAGIDFFGASSGTARGAPPANLPGAIPMAESPEPVAQRYQSQAVSESNVRWQSVVAHGASDSPSDWRLAILEADIILAEALDRAGYIGDTVGDKLKNAEQRPFASLNAAWEAHKVRNAIAHEGQDFQLTQREAHRVLNLYQIAIADILRIQ